VTLQRHVFLIWEQNLCYSIAYSNAIVIDSMRMFHKYICKISSVICLGVVNARFLQQVLR